MIAAMIDGICAQRDEGRILSIAAGHLREAEQSQAFVRQRISEWVAIDQDRLSVEECRRRYQGTSIHPVQGSVRDLLAGKFDDSKFDFVYAAGLFDYLKEPIARALASKMFTLLRPAGKLLVANFSSSHVDAGYMEAFMDWRLIYRTEANMRNLFAGIKENESPSVRLFTDEWSAITYAVVEKPAGNVGTIACSNTGIRVGQIA